MNTEESNLPQRCTDAFNEFYKAWTNVENAVAQLQNATEKARQSVSESSNEFARDPKSWQVLDRFLYLERLMLEAGQLVNDVRRGTDVPPGVDEAPRPNSEKRSKRKRDAG